MTKKKTLTFFLFISILLVSGCRGENKTFDISTPSTQQEVAEPETIVLEKISIPAGIEQMYPPEGLEASTTYPAWEVPTVEAQTLRPPTEAPLPASGKVSVSGLLFAFDISVPLSNINFVLIPAVVIDGVPRVPPILTYGNPKDGDVLGKTDGSGIFYLDNIMPGKYYLLVNYPDHSEIAVDPDNTSAPLLFDFKADTSYPRGVVLINS